ncbi:hypothetical protein GCM10010302_28850 [Streptomyces polychromogenes]|uniref:DUF3592 domain-containing protein n=1 Tax=Streptomyces polychromogenes TaxID=67342 RepID=A0ABP3F067_9ACTN
MGMPEEEPGRGRAAVAVLPVAAAALVYVWARWCFGGSAPPPSSLALAGGAVLVLGAAVAYFVPVRGAGGLFGALFLALGLLSTVAVVEGTAARGETATCTVREVRTKAEPSFGEGGADRTVYRLELDCPGGYPDELKDAPASFSRGARVRVAYDARRRLSPVLAGDGSPWKPALTAVLLLGLSTLLAARRRLPRT